LYQKKPLGNTSGFFTLGASGTFAKTKRILMSFHYLPTEDGGFIRKPFDSLTTSEKEFVAELKKHKPPYSEAIREKLLSILETPKKETNDSSN